MVAVCAVCQRKEQFRKLLTSALSEELNFLVIIDVWYEKLRTDIILPGNSGSFYSFYKSDTHSDKLACVCLLVCLKKNNKINAYSSDEWLFFFRKETATFSANEMMKKFVLSLAAENMDFVLTARNGR